MKLDEKIYRVGRNENGDFVVLFAVPIKEEDGLILCKQIEGNFRISEERYYRYAKTVEEAISQYLTYLSDRIHHCNELIDEYEKERRNLTEMGHIDIVGPAADEDTE